MSCSKVQRCERADHFQSTLPSYSHGVSFVHQQKNGLEFARKRYRFALASVEMRQSRIDGLLQAYYFQPFGRLRDPRAHTSRRVYMGQPDLHSGRDQNPLIFGTRRVVRGTPPRDLGAGGGIPKARNCRRSAGQRRRFLPTSISSRIFGARFTTSATTHGLDVVWTPTATALRNIWPENFWREDQRVSFIRAFDTKSEHASFVSDRRS